jgi:lipopolysaccharide transport system permease protein
MKITIYTPESSLRSPRKMVKEMFRDLLESRELAWRLAVRDINAQYRQTYLGYVWAFLLPVVNTATWIFLNATGIVKMATTGIPYPVYVFTGTMLWQIFTEAFQSPLNEVGAAKAMLAKLNFPREALILSGILKTLFNAAIKIVILIPVIILMGVYPDWRLLLFPLGVLSIILVGNTIGLLLAPLGVLYGDIGKTIPVLTQFLMFLTPVVFAMPTVGFTAKLFEMNFLTPLIMTAREWLTGNDTEWLNYFLGVNAVAVIMLFLGWVIYRITMPILIERMSA